MFYISKCTISSLILLMHNLVRFYLRCVCNNRFFSEALSSAIWLIPHMYERLFFMPMREQPVSPLTAKGWCIAVRGW